MKKIYLKETRRGDGKFSKRAFEIIEELSKNFVVITNKNLGEINLEIEECFALLTLVNVGDVFCDENTCYELRFAGELCQSFGLESMVYIFQDKDQKVETVSCFFAGFRTYQNFEKLVTKLKEFSNSLNPWCVNYELMEA